MLPTSRDLNPAVSGDLNRNISVIYRNKKFSYNSMASVVMDDSLFAWYWVYGKATRYLDVAGPRHPLSESGGTEHSITTDTYVTVNNATHVDVDDDIINDCIRKGNVMRPLQLAADDANHTLSIRIEREVQATLFTTGVWATDVSFTAAEKWSNYTTGDPQGMIDTYKNQIILASGNSVDESWFTLHIPRAGWIELCRHPQFLQGNSIYTVNQMATQEQVARSLGIGAVDVMSSVYNAAKRNAAASMTAIFGNGALLTCNPPTPSKEVPAAAYTFMDKDKISTKMERLPLRNGWRIEVEKRWVTKVVDSAMAVYFNAPV